MPTPAEWLFILFVVAVIFLVHRLGRMGDALGALISGGGQKEEPAGEVKGSTDEPPTETP